MIRSFRSKETESIWRGVQIRHVSVDVQMRVRRKLRVLNNMRTLMELQIPPGNRLEALRGDRKGQHSIRINDQYRLCFIWKDGDCFEVEMTDYH
jgi:proteic killer suppression protein